jgi:glycosyltransferase involved in cell wall biosynthesis
MHCEHRQGPRVLHVLHTLRSGGAQWRTAELVAHACRGGEEWGIVYLSEPSTLRGFLEEAGVQVMGPLSGSYRSWRNSRRLLEKALEFGADIVHAHTNWPGLWTASLRRHFRGPLVYSVRGRPFVSVWEPRGWINRYVFARVDWVVFISQHLRTNILRVWPQLAEKSGVIYTGLGARRLRPQKTRDQVRKELGLDPKQPVICAVGNILKIKGHEVAIRAMPLVSREEPEAVLLIVGEPVDMALYRKLEALTARLGLQDKVVMLGYREDVADLLAAADVFVMPSYSEGLPGALIEAMFTGCPVVASAVGGIPEVVTTGTTGVLVPPGDAEALAAAIKRLLADRDLAQQLAQRAQEEIRGRFTLQATYLGHRELYGRWRPLIEENRVAAGKQ